MSILLAVVIGCILDLILGDPQWLPHPIRLLGAFIGNGEKILRKLSRRNPKMEYWSGALLSVVVMATAFTLTLLLLIWLYKINLVLFIAVHALMCYQIMAIKSLKTESMQVYRALRQNDLPQARHKLSFIVSRDTALLDEKGVAKSVVETVSENTSDGVIAPLLFMLIGGAPLGFLYKSINTLDSMIGYKNEQYIRFGRFAAKLDDAANYLPARISAWMMILASWIGGYNWKKALQIYKRDRGNHPSPNSAQTEAVCAGALGIQIAGANYYFGQLVDKPTIGDDVRPVEANDIQRANKLMYTTFILTLATGVVIWLAVWALVNGG